MGGTALNLWLCWERHFGAIFSFPSFSRSKKVDVEFHELADFAFSSRSKVLLKFDFLDSAYFTCSHPPPMHYEYVITLFWCKCCGIWLRSRMRYTAVGCILLILCNFRGENGLLCNFRGENPQRCKTPNFYVCFLAEITWEVFCFTSEAFLIRSQYRKESKVWRIM